MLAVVEMLAVGDRLPDGERVGSGECDTDGLPEGVADGVSGCVRLAGVGVAVCSCEWLSERDMDWARRDPVLDRVTVGVPDGDGVPADGDWLALTDGEKVGVAVRDTGPCVADAVTLRTVCDGALEAVSVIVLVSTTEAVCRVPLLVRLWVGRVAVLVWETERVGPDGDAEREPSRVHVLDADARDREVVRLSVGSVTDNRQDHVAVGGDSVAVRVVAATLRVCDRDSVRTVCVTESCCDAVSDSEADGRVASSVTVAVKVTEDERVS